jgi:hypothetical protein
MARGGPDLEGWLVEAGQSFLGILLGSRAFLLALSHSWC